MYAKLMMTISECCCWVKWCFSYDQSILKEYSEAIQSTVGMMLNFENHSHFIFPMKYWHWNFLKLVPGWPHFTSLLFLPLASNLLSCLHSTLTILIFYWLFWYFIQAERFTSILIWFSIYKNINHKSVKILIYFIYLWLLVIVLSK